MFQFWLVPEAKQLRVLEEDRHSSKEVTSSMDNDNVHGTFADARGITVRFSFFLNQNLLNSAGAAHVSSLNLLSIEIRWHADWLG